MIEARGLGRAYELDGATVHALQGVDLEVEAGELVLLRGRSGSGKSTLLHLLGGLERPTEGLLKVAGLDLCTADDSTLSRLRSTAVGFVFQAFHLDDRRSALENVLLPVYFGSGSIDEGRRRALSLLRRVDLGGLEGRPVSRLSGGQRQRVAVARALVHRPRLLLADEPLGHLDDASAGEVLRLLADLHREEGLTLIASTHDQRVFKGPCREIQLLDGRPLEAPHPGGDRAEGSP